MTTIFRSSLESKVGWTWRDEQDRSAVVDSNQWLWRISLQEGTDEGQANAVWYVLGKTLASGASNEWDLTALSRTLFNASVNQAFASVKALYVINRKESTGNLIIGGASTNSWPGPFSSVTQTIRVVPGGVLLVVHPNAGWSVSASAKNLKLAAESGSVTYDLILVGVKAG